jgi:hypothetical protein
MANLALIQRPAGPAKPRIANLARGALIGGTVAGVVDIFAAAAINQASPALILKCIASGLVGPPALHGGVGAVVLGFILQVAMSLLIAAIFAAGAARLPILLRRPYGAGALFGVGVFAVMTFVVLPLSAAPHPKHAPSPAFIALNLAAMVLFGLIVSLSQARTQGRPAH